MCYVFLNDFIYITETGTVIRNARNRRVKVRGPYKFPTAQPPFLFFRTAPLLWTLCVVCFMSAVYTSSCGKLPFPSLSNTKMNFIPLTIFRLSQTHVFDCAWDLKVTKIHRYNRRRAFFLQTNFIICFLGH